jgi:hypothetical protein
MKCKEIAVKILTCSLSVQYRQVAMALFDWQALPPPIARG